MAIIDPTTSLGKCRLRCGDFSDNVLLPDSVYTQALLDASDNVNQASLVCATYILAMLSQKSHRKLQQLESWDNEKFNNYFKYLNMIAKDSSFSGINPIPYSASGTETHPMIQFQNDFRDNYVGGTQSDQLALDAIPSNLTQEQMLQSV